MEYVRLGGTGLEVSRVCLGCMSFGDPARGRAWALPPDEAEPFIARALDLGFTFFDTANVYSAGSSEEIVGPALKRLRAREEVVLATKVHGRMGPGPGQGGLSRKAIFAQCDASLRRLETDYIDLYQIHRWDPHTPIEETLEALSDLVRAGKVRYLGASSMFAWQFSKSLYLAERHGWSRFVSMQNHYNLLYREEENEMIPLCQNQQIGLIPWSPLARGRVARPWDSATARSQTDEFGQHLYVDSDRLIVEQVAEVAQARGAAMASVGLAWMLAKPYITAPIVGVTSQQHLDDAVAALHLKLEPEEIDRLEQPYEPHRRAGF